MAHGLHQHSDSAPEVHNMSGEAAEASAGPRSGFHWTAAWQQVKAQVPRGEDKNQGLFS